MDIADTKVYSVREFANRFGIPMKRMQAMLKLAMIETQVRGEVVCISQSGAKAFREAFPQVKEKSLVKEPETKEVEDAACQVAEEIAIEKAQPVEAWAEKEPVMEEKTKKITTRKTPAKRKGAERGKTYSAKEMLAAQREIARLEKKLAKIMAVIKAKTVR